MECAEWCRWTWVVPRWAAQGASRNAGSKLECVLFARENPMKGLDYVLSKAAACNNHQLAAAARIGLVCLVLP
jgi:hypothetical protein